jgi:hypothetical protein
LPPPGPGPIAVPLGPHRLTYVVEEELKGDLPERIEIVSYIDGGMCGLPASLGARYGMLLRREGETWKPAGADVYDPELLRRGLLPLPDPDGAGQAVLLAGGAFGEARMATLDERGRVLAYGWGRGGVNALAVCSGGRFSLELTGADGQTVVVTRQLPDLRVVARRELDLSWAGAIACLDATGADALVLGYASGATGQMSLLRLTQIGTATLEKAQSLSFIAVQGGALISRPDGSLVRRRFASGSRTVILRTRGPLTGISVSPDRRFAAGFAAGSLVVVDLLNERMRSRQGVSALGGTHWLDGGLLAVSWAGYPSAWLEVVDLSLRTIRGPFFPWGTGTIASRGQEVFGLDWSGRLLHAGSTGEPRSLRTLFSPGVRTLAALP